VTLEQSEAARAALREVIEDLAAIVPPFTPEEETCIQLSMRRDELLRALHAARVARDREATIAAGDALIKLDEEYADLVSGRKVGDTP
jgi:hypothetical protein